jgi:hypothetical protein
MTHAQPVLGVERLAGEFFHIKATPFALLRYPNKRMPYHARCVRYMAGSDPMISAIILMRRQGRKVRREKDTGWDRIAKKKIERGLNLPLAGVAPYRSCQEIIELGGESRRIEIGIKIEPRPLFGQQFRNE